MTTKLQGQELRSAIGQQLIEIADSLRALALWDDVPPTDKALSSQMPFCADTLKFEQWLQWIFIPRMQMLLDNGGDLPTMSGILPMAEEMMKSVQDPSQLFRALETMDQLLTEPSKK